MKIVRITYYKAEGEYHISLQGNEDGKFRSMRTNYLTKEEKEWIDGASSRIESPEKIKWTNW